MKRFSSKIRQSFGVACLFLGAAHGAAHAQSVTPVTTTPVFVDDFSGGSLDRGQWNIYDDSRELHRTQFGLEPQLGRDSDGTTWMRVAQQTFNPNPLWSGKKTAGAEVISQQTWSLGTGKEFEARMRMNNLSPGVVLGFFTYFADGIFPETYSQTEIDYEFLTNLGGDKVWTNIFDDFNVQRSVDKGGGPFSAAGLNWNDGAWHTFKIRWTPSETLWIIDDHIALRREVSILPGTPMAVRFNSWTPRNDWKEAYNGAVNPAATAEENREIAYDVDYIKVRPVPASGAAFGSGNGLKASYFNDSNFSDKELERTDGRINFDWGAFSPQPDMPTDGFSVRWEGSIQSRYSEATTLSLRADDGVRMYLNNKLVLDAMSARGLNTHSFIWNARAGEKVALRVEFVDVSGAAQCQLNWQSASQPLVVVPQSQLYTETATTVPTPTPAPTTAPTPTPKPTPAPAFVVAPTFSIPAGTYGGAQSVKVSSVTKGASIRYTFDGSTPTHNSMKLGNGKALRLSTSTLLRAIAVGKKNATSTVSDANYTIVTDTTPPSISVETPMHRSTISAFTSVDGLASDIAIANTIGTINRVEVRLDRSGGTSFWNGKKWNSRPSVLKTTLAPAGDGVRWTLVGALPSGKNLTNGTYTIMATAFDSAGSVASAMSTVTVVVADAPSASGS